MIVDRHVYTDCGRQVGVFAHVLHNCGFMAIVSIVTGFSCSKQTNLPTLIYILYKKGVIHV